MPCDGLEVWDGKEAPGGGDLCYRMAEINTMS